MSTVNPFGPRQSRPARRNALLLALLATLSLSACGGGGEDGNQDAGQGRRLFDNLPPEHIELDLVRTLEAPGTLHLRYEVQRQ
jgi:hypothetical protein